MALKLGPPASVVWIEGTRNAVGTLRLGLVLLVGVLAAELVAVFDKHAASAFLAGDHVRAARGGRWKICELSRHF